MNTDHDNPVPPDQEARITSLLLGELTPAEAAALSTDLQANPDLALLHERLRQTLALVSEAVAASPAPQHTAARVSQFSKSRREVLLRVLKSEPTPVKKVKDSSRDGGVPWFRIAALIAVLGIAAALSIPNFVKARLTLPRSSTIEVASDKSVDFAETLPAPPPAWMAERAETDRLAISQAPVQSQANGARARSAKDDSIADGDSYAGVYLPASPGAEPPAANTRPQVPASANFGESKLALQPSETPEEARADSQELERLTRPLRTESLADNLSEGKENLSRGALVDPQASPTPKTFKGQADLPASNQTPPRPAEPPVSKSAAPAMMARYGLAARSATAVDKESQTLGESLDTPSRSPESGEPLSNRRRFGADATSMKRAPAPTGPAKLADAAVKAGAKPRLDVPVPDSRDQSALALSLPRGESQQSLSLGRGLFRKEEETRSMVTAGTAAGKGVADKAPQMGGFAGGRVLGEAARPSAVFFGREPVAKPESASQAPVAPSQAPKAEFSSNFFFKNDAASPETASATTALAEEPLEAKLESFGVQAGRQAGREKAEGKFDAKLSEGELVSERIAESIPSIALEEKKKAPSLGLAKRPEVQFSDLEHKSQPPVGAPTVAPAPVPQPEQITQENSISTFSLNVSDVSFKLAAASLASGTMPSPGTIRSEEFINAFDYRDPQPSPGSPIAFAWDRARYAFGHNQDLLRFSLKTAASGREPGRPCNLVILLDNSGSMERSDRVGIIREILVALGSKLGPQDRVSVVAFARTSRLWVDGLLGSQSAEVLRRIGELIPEGGTNLEEALRLGYETALRHFMNHGMNRVVLLTDGAANLGETNPEALQSLVETHRKRGVALDCFGIGWEGYNDLLLERLSRNGDGRYGFVNSVEEASTSFVNQLAGALNVAAADVKVQVEFNPLRVPVWRQIGYATHQLKKEQFRDNTVDAAEIAAAEAGNALYVVRIDPQGQGPIGVVRARFREPSTGIYRELEWSVPYAGGAAGIEMASPAMRLAGTSALFAEWLAASPYAAEVTLGTLQSWVRGVPDSFSPDPRPRQLETMLRQARSLSGK